MVRSDSPTTMARTKHFSSLTTRRLRQLEQIPETGEYPTSAELTGNLSSIVPNGQLLNPFTGTPFAGSIIPMNMIRPAALEGFLQMESKTGPWVALPNVTGQPGFDYETNGTENYTDNQYITRIDRKLTDKTNIYGHFAFDNQTRTDPNNHPNWGDYNDITAYSVAAIPLTRLAPTSCLT